MHVDKCRWSSLHFIYTVTRWLSVTLMYCRDVDTIYIKVVEVYIKKIKNIKKYKRIENAHCIYYTKI